MIIEKTDASAVMGSLTSTTNEEGMDMGDENWNPRESANSRRRLALAEPTGSEKARTLVTGHADAAKVESFSVNSTP